MVSLPLSIRSGSHQTSTDRMPLAPRPHIIAAAHSATIATESQAQQSEAPGCPRLLVSVRDADEASAAIRGGADIIDVKEPARGALGMADPGVIRDVLRTMSGIAPRAPVSAALGELIEWEHSPERQSLPGGLSYLKLGLAGVGADPSWITRWLKVRSGIDRALAEPCGWIAVVYADAAVAGGPVPEAVIDAAISTGCRGVLFDTFGKQGGSLLDHPSGDTFFALSRVAREGGLLVALAGRLTATHLCRLSPLEPDIVAIRSAACADGDRAAAVCLQRVSQFRRHMHETAWHAEGHGRRRPVEVRASACITQPEG